MAASKDTSSEKGKTRRPTVSQSDVPSVSLESAFTVCQAIWDNYAGDPSKPLAVAKALEKSPASSAFRMTCGASIAYGLTEGGYNAEFISITELGRKILAPTEEGMRESALIEASMRPKVCGQFIKKYDGNRFPRTDIATNVLIDMGVPKGRESDTLSTIRKNAEYCGILTEIKGNTYLDSSAAGAAMPTDPEIDKPEEPDGLSTENDVTDSKKTEILREINDNKTDDQEKNNKVFITHGKNSKILEQVKEIVKFGRFEPVVAIEHETASKPVPQKIMDDMRTCSAAVIHVSSEGNLLDPNGEQHAKINGNVLIEIGAAMALYKGRFILLVEDGVKLPSNLQGLYEVRYTGGILDGDATMKLLKAFNDFK